MEIEVAPSEMYVSTSSSSDMHVMSERVQMIAGSIYREFEKLMSTYDENVVKDLTPLVVTVLENLEQSLQERQERDVELELLREDNEQLMTQYEREKQLRRNAEMNYFGLEDAFEEKQAKGQVKIESLESIVRMFEIKMKNSQEQITRLEEKDVESRKEFSVLHERYTDLLRAHSDYKDRMQVLLSADSPAVSSKRLSRYLNRGENQSQSILSGFSDTLLTPRSDLSHRLPLDLTTESVHEKSANVSRGAFEVLSESLVETDEKDVSTDVVDVKDSSTETANDLNFDDRKFDDRNLPSANSNILSSSLYDELIIEDVDALNQLDFGADIIDSDDDVDLLASEEGMFGMSREVEILIKENHELLETKNALNVVKNDLIGKVDELSSEKDLLREEITSLQVVREKLKLRVSDLEEEVGKMREELLQKTSQLQQSEEDETVVSAAQRKRFTRAEMARVLMERNQYKERLMELQEAIRWTEMHRAMREQPEVKKQSYIFKFFSNLLRKTPQPQPASSVQYRVKSSASLPSDLNKRFTSVKSVHFREDQIAEEQARKIFRNEERRWLEAETKEDPNDLQANGWLLPAKFYSLESTGTSAAKPLAQKIAVPIPIFSRPISQDVNMQIWCAAAVNLSGYNYLPGSAHPINGKADDARPTSNFELDSEVSCSDNSSSSSPISPSLLWICTASRSGSDVIVADANSLSEVLAKFYVSSSHVLCVTGVPGVMEDDLTTANSIVVTSPSSATPTKELGTVSYVLCNESEIKQPDYNCSRSPGDSPRDNEATPISSRLGSDSPMGVTNADNGDRVSSRLPTMWIGTQSGRVYVHCAVRNVEQRLHCIKLPDSVVDLVHIRGRVVIALANGSVAVFCRGSDREWNVDGYHTVTIGEPYKSVRSLCAVGNERVWCGYQNKIHVLNSDTLAIERSFDAHPRLDSQVRHMVCIGDGVWISIRLDSTLRLYHAVTCQHLQDIDIEPHVSKLLGTGNVGFSFVRISCLMASCNRLWIGTSSGIILSVPLFESNQQSVMAPSTGRPGGLVRVYGSNVETPGGTAPAGLIPFCNISQVQLSYHGLKDAVKFFVALPGSPVVPSVDTPAGGCDSSKNDEPSSSSSVSSTGQIQDVLVIVSGGEGYVDFRTGSGKRDVNGATVNSRADYTLPRSARPERGHLLAWQFNAS